MAALSPAYGSLPLYLLVETRYEGSSHGLLMNSAAGQGPVALWLELMALETESMGSIPGHRKLYLFLFFFFLLLPTPAVSTLSLPLCLMGIF